MDTGTSLLAGPSEVVGAGRGNGRGNGRCWSVRVPGGKLRSHE